MHGVIDPTTQIAAIYRAHGPFSYTMVNYPATDQ